MTKKKTANEIFYEALDKNKEFMSIKPQEKYLQFKDLEQKQQDFYNFLLYSLLGISAKPRPNCSVGSLCAYLTDALKAQQDYDYNRLELYDFLSFHEGE